jgi:asparagine synthase (glutamine-hydrolysing)
VLVGDGPPRAWRRPVRFRPVNLDLPAAVDAVRAALETAVSRRSHDAGRLGAQLSGGMDSTSVLATAAALAVRSSGPAPRMAFTAHYPELPECDETALARQVAERWRVPWSPVTVHPRELLPDDGRALGLHDGPVFPGFAVQSRLMSAAAEQVDVLLSGAGGDNWLRQESQEVRLALLRGAWRSAGEWAWWYGRYGGRWRSIVRQGLDAAQQAIHGVSAEAEFADRASHFGVRWSLELIEREGMRHGLRVELPFYDFELANLLAGLPVDVRSTRGVTKRVMRAAMDGQLPEAVRGRKDWTDSGLLLRAAIGETAAGERASQVLARHFAERWRREAGSPGDARAAGE